MAFDKEIPVCRTCGSSDVLSDAWATWDVEQQSWELSTTFDDKYCQRCDGECKVNWVNADEHVEPE